jgi:hypothetical protein
VVVVMVMMVMMPVAREAGTLCGGYYRKGRHSSSGIGITLLCLG